MTGEQVKTVLLHYKVSQSEIARQLGMSQQSINQMLSTADVKSSLVERIAKVLNVPVSHIYGDRDDMQSAVASGDSSIAVNNITGNIEAGDNAALLERVKLLEQLLAERERVIEEKERTIKILMER